jgi:AraC-like DNA-binding protein
MPFLSAQYKSPLLISNIQPAPDNAVRARDLDAIVAVQNQLAANYLDEFPSIQALARSVWMSESKFKKLYKRIFGTSPFEYYQKNRMQKARELLLEGRFSISEIGNMLGYQNLSNFSSSFKKEFAELPSNIVRASRA